MRIAAFLTGVSDSLGLLAYNIKQKQAIQRGAECIHYTPSMVNAAGCKAVRPSVSVDVWDVTG